MGRRVDVHVQRPLPHMRCRCPTLRDDTHLGPERDESQSRGVQQGERGRTMRIWQSHLKSWLIGIPKVFANFTSVVSRRSFSPRSMAPVNDRARSPLCASSSWDQSRLSRSARTRLPRRFLTAVAFCIHHTIRLNVKWSLRSVVGPSVVGHNEPCSLFVNRIATLRT